MMRYKEFWLHCMNKMRSHLQPFEFIQQKLGGPTIYEYEKLQAEISDLQTKYNELLCKHEDACKELEELKNMHSSVSPSTKETNDGEPLKDEHVEKNS
ncbi:hypothetical protein GOBAR_AA01322 [Gossypium barbadense]|uniref:Uncharacterized protein n=1 Tax=Gossypium barbadense TaxID=3634 RepID=A0A2P5YUM3_GOSBA|nr:hypothetical protein GOBAR_AA01322 [Gossypium barbadense]